MKLRTGIDSYTNALRYFAGVFLFSLAILSNAEKKKRPPVPAGKKRYIVSLKTSAPIRKMSAKSIGKTIEEFDNLNMYVQDLTEREARALRADKANVLAVEEDGPVLSGDNPNLLSITEQITPNSLKRMALDTFPVTQINNQENSRNVHVAVIDSGVDPHEDIDVFQRHSMVNDNLFDQSNHGTSVAGIIGALDNNIGIVGASPGVKIWSVKVEAPGDFMWSYVTGAMSYVLSNANQISVVNMSLTNTGTNAPINSLRLGIRRLVRAGVVVVAAVGNRNIDMAGPDGVYNTGDDAVPASFPEVMAVSAMDSTYNETTKKYADKFWIGTPGSFGSNYSQIPRPIPTDNPDPTVVYPVSNGGAIDVAAPGVNVEAPIAGIDPEDGLAHEYALRGGTSFAAPYVAGLVANYIAANGRAYNEKGVYKIRQAIIDESQRLMPQSMWDSALDGVIGSDDPDTNHEALAYASEAWIPRVRVKMTPSSNRNDFEISTDSPDCLLVPCSIPGYRYFLEYTQDFLAWSTLATFTGNGQKMQAYDGNMDPEKRFYRVRAVRAP